MSDAPLDGDRQVVGGAPPPSSRVALNRELIVRTAVEFIEASGLPLLTMRKLGEALGVEAMSLYRYVPGREDLLDAIVDTVIDDMTDDPDVLTTPENGWQDFLQRLAHGVRRMALTRPQCFPLVASRPPAAPWLRPPLRSLAWVEMFLQGLLDEGFSERAAVDTYRAFSSFLLGHLLLEVAGMGAAVGPLDLLQPAPDPSDVNEIQDDAATAAAFPAVVRLADHLSLDNSVVEFEESLENLLDRIATLVAGR